MVRAKGARPRSTVVAEVVGVETNLLVPGAVACAGALSNVSITKRKLERTVTLKGRNKIMRFADGERNKHRPAPLGIAKI